MHNRQYYLCHDCNRTFAGNDALPGMRYTPEQIATALNLFYEGLSIDKIRREVDNQYHLYPSDSTVYEWVVRFSKQAVNEAKISDVKVGDFWVADETMLPIGGENTWFWDIIDEKTRFLLSSRISRSRTKQDAQILIDRAIKTAGKNPQVVITDRLASYLDIRYGKGAEHVQGSPFTSKDSTNLIERFHGTLKSRTEVMRGMKNIETARIIMDGWLIYYNFFRPHESLNNKTPAEMARASFPYKNWHEVVMQGGERSNVCSSK
jgi:transposase-like protein